MFYSIIIKIEGCALSGSITSISTNSTISGTANASGFYGSYYTLTFEVKMKRN